jgi:hypothetical protein
MAGLDPAIPFIEARPRLVVGIAGSSPAMTAVWLHLISLVMKLLPGCEQVPQSAEMRAVDRGVRP